MCQHPWPLPAALTLWPLCASAPICAPTEVRSFFNFFLLLLLTLASPCARPLCHIPNPIRCTLHAVLTPPSAGLCWSHQCPVGSVHYVVPLGHVRYADAHGMCTLCLCPRLPCPSPRVCAHSHDCTTTGGSSGGSLFGNTAMMTANQPQPQTGGGGGSLFGSSASNQPQSQSGGGGGGLFGSSCHRRRSDND